MELSTLDLVLIVGYAVLVIGIGLAFRRRAGKGMDEFFVSGRSLPWWIAGTSMVATTFAADTPLAVSGLVAKDGLAGNWVWWCLAAGGMVTVFVYARLWRRAGVLTDVELIELRYRGRAASFLRGFRAIYVALLVNAIIIGWVAKAMFVVLEQTVLWEEGGEPAGTQEKWLWMGGLLALVGLYSSLSGLWGVAVADFIQFFLAMGGCIALAWIAVDHVGGTAELEKRVVDAYGSDQVMAFVPDFSSGAGLPLGIFAIMVGVQWWASWYPGSEPGGGGYVVQRMAACKNERHAVLATLWYQVAHYCLRPWPWILVAFAALALYPEIRQFATDGDDQTDPGKGYPMVLRELAPPGLRGLLLVAFGAAFMSTISTQMNWGASYLVNDVYKRFVKPDATDRQLATAARIASVVVLVAGGLAAGIMTSGGVSVDEAWKLLLALGAGTGAVFMLRWFWWRINAWTEISSMVASLVLFVIAQVALPDLRDEERLLFVAVGTIVVWVVVTFATRPEGHDVLEDFFRKVRPGGPGWGPVAARAPDVEVDRDLGRGILAAVLGIAVIYLTLPGIGAAIFGRWGDAGGLLAGAAACAVGMAWVRPRVT